MAKNKSKLGYKSQKKAKNLTKRSAGRVPKEGSIGANGTYDGFSAVHNLGEGDTYYIPKLYKSARETQAAFATLVEEVDWVQMFYFHGSMEKDNQTAHPIPRLVAAQTTKGDGPSAIYRMPGCNQGNINTKDWTPTVRRACELASDAIGHELNHCVCTLYRDENDSLAFHHDKLLDLEPNSVIVSISFGEARPIEFQRKKGTGKQTIMLQPGSLLAIGPKTNIHWLHAIPKLDRPTGPRVSLSARSIATFVREAGDDGAAVIEGQGEEYQTVNYPFVKNFDNEDKYSPQVLRAMNETRAQADEWVQRLREDMASALSPNEGSSSSSSGVESDDATSESDSATEY